MKSMCEPFKLAAGCVIDIKLIEVTRPVPCTIADRPSFVGINH
jgi:hypothetical protein